MEFCRYEKTGHVARITVTRPEVMNALHPPAGRELQQAWDEFANDDDDDVDDDDEIQEERGYNAIGGGGEVGERIDSREVVERGGQASSAAPVDLDIDVEQEKNEYACI